MAIFGRFGPKNPYISVRAMTFVEDVAALRRLLGVAMHLELQPAISAMNLAMGLDGGSPLRSQVAEAHRCTCSGGWLRFRRFLACHSPVKIEGSFLNSSGEKMRVYFLTVRFLNAHD